MSWLLLAAGGFLGACSRFSLSVWLNGKGSWGTAGTLLANISGSALLALLWALDIDEWFWLFAGAGFAGAFTTFSTFGKELVDLLEKGKTVPALSYFATSIFVSLLTVWSIVWFFSN